MQVGELESQLELTLFHRLPRGVKNRLVDGTLDAGPDRRLAPKRDGVIAALRADTETVTTPYIFLTAKGEKPNISCRNEPRRG
jgi:hypothetical protein